MPRLLPAVLCLALPWGGSGCGSGASASGSGGAPQPSGGGEAWGKGGAWERSSSKGASPGTLASVKAAKKSTERLLVEIDEVEVLQRGVVELEGPEPSPFEVEGAETPEEAAALGVILALKVRVMNGFDNLKLRVGPARFSLESADGTPFAPVFSAAREPALRDRRLRESTSTYGWLFFRVPREETKLILKCDLRRPPLLIPVPAPSR